MELISYIKAGYAFFYVRSDEIQRTVELLTEQLRSYKEELNLLFWDFATTPDPDAVFEQLESGETGSVMIAKNFNWFLKDEYGAINKTIVSLLQARAEAWTTGEYRKVLIVVSNEGFDSAIPDVISKQFVPVDADLPSREDVNSMLDKMIGWAKEANSDKFVEPDDKGRAAIVDSALGMTKSEVNNAMALSLVKGEGKMDPNEVFLMKAKDVEKTAGVKIGKFDLTFESLKGYDNVKEFTKMSAKHPLSKGVMLLGPPGVGKTHFCKCLGNEVGLPVLVAEMAELFGGIVGETEKLVKSFISVVKSLTQCILFVDEIEKGLAGIKGGGADGAGTTGDSVAKRAMAQFLKFLSDDRPEGVYVIATCNDISSLPPEWVRAGRWDCAPFFIDLPNDDEKQQIYDHYIEHFREVTDGKFKSDLTVKEMSGWSGAEIESLCRIAGMFSISTKSASRFIVPVSKTMDKEITYLRKWAENRTIPATIKVVNGKSTGKRSLEL